VTPEHFAALVRLAPDASAHAQHGFAEAFERHVALGTDISGAALQGSCAMRGFIFSARDRQPAARASPA